MKTETARLSVFAGPSATQDRTRLRSMLMGATGLALASTSGVAFAQEGDAAPAAAEVSAPVDDAATTAAEEERMRRLGIVTATARRKEESLQDAPVDRKSVV